MPERNRHVGRLGRYTLIEKLAEGGMGSVHAALRDGDRSLCVLKQLRADVGHDEVAVRRFYREASVGAQLIHPRIAKVLGAGTEDGTFCIAMEMVFGLDLDRIHTTMTQQGRLVPPAIVIRTALGVLDALSYAHAARDARGDRIGVVHRDLTLRNVMLGFDGEAKIIDFGLVRGTVDSLRTRPGVFMGTPKYASPEQASGVPVDARSDLYSVAACLFELLTGRPVAMGNDLMDILRAVREERAPLALEVNPLVPAAVSSVIARGLEKDPTRRWPDAASFRDALRAAYPDDADIRSSDLAAFMHGRFNTEVERLRALMKRCEELVSSAAPLHERARAYADPDTRTELDDDGPSAEPTFVEFAAAEPIERTALLAIGPRERRAAEESVLLTPPAIPTWVGRTVKVAAPRERGTPWGLIGAVAVIAAAAGSAVTATWFTSRVTSSAPEAAIAAPPTTAAPAPFVAVTASVAKDPPEIDLPPSARPVVRAPSPVSARTPPTIATPAPRIPASSGPLHAQLEAYVASPSDAARRALTRAIEGHPERAKVELELMRLSHAISDESAIKHLRAAVAKLEP